MKLIQLISFSIALIVVKGSVIAQSNIKPYIKDSNGVITYYDKVKEGFSTTYCWPGKHDWIKYARRSSRTMAICAKNR